MLNRKKERFKYLTGDFVSALITWILFFIFRKRVLEPQKFETEVELVFDEKFYIALVLIPFFWITLYYLLGYYKDPYRKSRLSELGKTLYHTLIGVTLLFFAVILDDEIAEYKSYYISYSTLFGIHFTLTAIPRLILSTLLAIKIHNKIIGFNTLIVGSNQKAKDIYDRLVSNPFSGGYLPVGFVHVNGNILPELKKELPHLGSAKNLSNIIDEKAIEEVVIAIESGEHEKIEQIINIPDPERVQIKIIPGMHDILAGRVKMTAIFGAPLIAVKREFMPVWQQYIKRTADVVLSILSLILLFPVFIILAILIKLDSRGSVFYTQERIGKNEKPFHIIKFRSMIADAEKNKPQLAEESDPRITNIGRFMRKTRLDEVPQFINVLMGDMSIVGPRPERQFYIDQIIKQAPHYRHLLKVRPGITSWGQVKFGYASNIEEMVRRLEYDIIYIENMSLFVDLKILIYTVLIVLKGEGK